ncbi:MAG: hypothetical protein RR877_00810 [Aurantimicrobium sp.]|uniref:DnaB family ATPase n=1 Tax=Aurantimicrobium sp. TaxID=1930784 RepID=UPI002FC8AEF8
MNDLLLLVKSITLLYRESLLDMEEDSTKDLVRKVIEAIKTPEVSIGITKDLEIINALKATATEMVNHDKSHKYQKDILLQQLQVNCGADESTYESLQSGIEPEMSEDENKLTVINIRTAIATHFKYGKIEEVLSKRFSEFKFKRSGIKNINKWINTMIAELEPFQVVGQERDSAIIDEVDISDKESINRVYASIKEENEGGGGFITGFQGINGMIGGKFRLGEQWGLYGLQHNYKTGFSLTIFKQVCMYNTPVLKDPKKKPLLLRISFEDSLVLNFQYLYKNMWENETGKVLSKKDLAEMDIGVMTEYVTNKLSATGFHVKLLFVNPSDWTYKDICNLVLKYEAEGYEVQMVMVDYLTKISKEGCTQGATGQDVRNLFERVKAFMASKGILFITPHQLSTEAKGLMRDGFNDFVKRLPGGGYTADSKQIDQVIDGELFFHIERLKGKNEAYFTVQGGKLRRIEQVDEDDKYRVYKFVRKGVILDDLNKPDSSMLKVGGTPLGEMTAEENWDQYTEAKDESMV